MYISEIPFLLIFRLRKWSLKGVKIIGLDHVANTGRVGVKCGRLAPKLEIILSPKYPKPHNTGENKYKIRNFKLVWQRGWWQFKTNLRDVGIIGGVHFDDTVINLDLKVWVLIQRLLQELEKPLYHSLEMELYNITLLIIVTSTFKTLRFHISLCVVDLWQKNTGMHFHLI